MEVLDDFEDAGLQIAGSHARVGAHFVRRGLEEAVVVDVADDQFGQTPVARAQVPRR